MRECARTPGSLIETNYLLLNLNPPCALADSSWIKPGKAAWDWWSGSYATDVDFRPGMNSRALSVPEYMNLHIAIPNVDLLGTSGEAWRTIPDMARVVADRPAAPERAVMT